ncbi:MAG: DUF177 domain-containing protein [Gammaproteobacteria bacterium]
MSDKAQKLPQFIDPFRLAETGRMYEGNLSLRQMKRLLLLLDDSSISLNNELSLTLAFDKDMNGIHFLSGTIKGTLKLLCQRCLNQMDFTINVDFLIAFLASEFDEEKLGGEYEPYIVTDTPIMLSDIIEDEMLLAIPTIPKHENTQCSTQFKHQTHTKSDTVLTEDDKATNPFSILKDLNK